MTGFLATEEMMRAKERRVLNHLQSQIDRLRLDGKEMLWRADVLAEAHTELSKAFGVKHPPWRGESPK